MRKMRSWIAGSLWKKNLLHPAASIRMSSRLGRLSALWLETSKSIELGSRLSYATPAQATHTTIIHNPIESTQWRASYLPTTQHAEETDIR
mmetsp:Transcript_34641/g.79045  ORF Transcript_34641/g.79045 Transcript_34641/m.79045 type:complete len:91 (+) Transcript_34641:37-309(+)